MEELVEIFGAEVGSVADNVLGAEDLALVNCGVSCVEELEQDIIAFAAYQKVDRLYSVTFLIEVLVIFKQTWCQLWTDPRHEWPVLFYDEVD